MVAANLGLFEFVEIFSRHRLHLKGIEEDKAPQNGIFPVHQMLDTTVDL